MDHVTKDKLLAAGKIGFGVARVVGSFALATGHGAIGLCLKNHSRMALAAHLAKRGFEAGKDLVDEGLDDWNRTKS